MKILHIITSLRVGGAERLIVDLIPILKEGNNIVDLLLFDGTKTSLREEAERRGIKIIDLGIGGSVYSPKLLIKLIPYLKKYDIIHTHNTAPQLFAAIGSIGSKVNLITTEHNTFNRRRNIKWFKPIDKWMYNRYKYIINISQKAEHNLRIYLGGSQAKITTINNGIDLTKFTQAKPSTLLEEIAPGSIKIIMVAGFREQKDHPTLIKSLKLLPENFHLFLIGDGEMKFRNEKLIEEENLKDRIHLLGIRSDIPQLLKASDIIVLSSHYEGLSLSSIEGMSVEKPFLASDVDGLREIVNGAGIIFEHGNQMDLAQKIQDLWSSKEYYNRISSECSKRANQFNIEETAKKYLNVYISLKNK